MSSTTKRIPTIRIALSSDSAGNRGMRGKPVGRVDRKADTLAAVSAGLVSDVVCGRYSKLIREFSDA
jgi:hypothetical protein